MSRTLQIFIAKQHMKQGNFFGFLMITNSNGGAPFDFLTQISFHRNIVEFAALHYYVIYFKTLSCFLCILFLLSEADLGRTYATSKMELFVIIVNGLQPLTIITKCSILNVAAVLDPSLVIMMKFLNGSRYLLFFFA